jgi:cytochrome c556
MRTGVVVGLMLMGSGSYASELSDYRHNVMEAVGGHMQAIVKIAKNEVPYSTHLGVLASNMVGLAEISGDIFREGSEGGEALPAIWSEPEAFAKRLAAFQDAARDFNSVVVQDDKQRFGESLQALGQACKACHDDFREED